MKPLVTLGHTLLKTGHGAGLPVIMSPTSWRDMVPFLAPQMIVDTRIPFRAVFLSSRMRLSVHGRLVVVGFHFPG
jgi:hypothetical protein